MPWLGRILLLPPRPGNSKTTERGTSRPAASPGTSQPREKPEACFPTEAAASRDVSRSVVVVSRCTPWLSAWIEAIHWLKVEKLPYFKLRGRQAGGSLAATKKETE